MLWLIFAHFIADWSLQSDWIAQNKGKYWFVMFAHCAVWTGLVCAFYAAFVRNDGRLETATMSVDPWKISFLFVGHFICDSWKCIVYKRKPFCQQETYWHLYVDQAWHIFQCWVVWQF